MPVKDYIFQVFGEDHVASLHDNRIYKVSTWGDDYIHLENGKMFCFYSKQIHREYIDVIDKLRGIDIQSNFWTAKQWKRECLLNIFTNS